jgi:hypothetical protein
MVVFGHALNNIVSSSGAAVKIIASIKKSTEKPKAHPLLIQKILTPQVFWSQVFNASTQASSSSAESC